MSSHHEASVSGGIAFSRRAADEGLIDHVVHDCHGACSRNRNALRTFSPVSALTDASKVLEDLAKQFRVERDLRLGGGILFHGKFVAAEKCDQASLVVVFGKEQPVGNRKRSVFMASAPWVDHVVAEVIDSIGVLPALCLKAVQTVKQAAVDEWCPGKERHERVPRLQSPFCIGIGK